jgi:Putative transposase
VLARIVSASVQGRVALGARGGARVRRLGEEPDAAAMSSRGPRHAHPDGFDLHVDVWVAARDRAGVQRLCRYVLRPPLAQERLRLRDDGRVQLDLKTPWHDGTRHLVFEPREFLEKLAALIPRPEVNLIICHGLLAPHARWRASVVVYGRPASEAVDAGDGMSAPRASPEDGRRKRPPRSWSWAALMQRAFAIDVLACPSCGGRMRLIATIHGPAVIRRILEHLRACPWGVSSGRPTPAHPRYPLSRSSARPWRFQTWSPGAATTRIVEPRRPNPRSPRIRLPLTGPLCLVRMPTPRRLP